jgi:SPASM domain peptide maturase of grasp-with-spasm system
MKKEYFKVFANCQIVKGYVRGVIIDLQNQNYLYLSPLLIEILEKTEELSIDELIDSYNGVPNATEVIKSFLNQLSNKGYGFVTHDPENFPKLEWSFESPFMISNAVIYFNDVTNNDMLFQQLSDIGTESIGFVLRNLSEETVKEIYMQTKGKRFKSVQIFYENLLCTEDESILKIISPLTPLLTHLYIFNCEKSDAVKRDNVMVIKTTAPLSSIRETKSFSSIKNFAVNIMHFRESLSFNTFLNRKVTIDENGDIKNSFNCNQTFGNIFNNDIKGIVNTVGFQKHWFVHKGLIDVCKDCEFRHVCVDNRIPKQRTDSTWYHESECDYNPYIAKWANEEGYKSLKESGFEYKEFL